MDLFRGQKILESELLVLIRENTEDLQALYSQDTVDFDEAIRLNRHRRALLEALAEEAAKVYGENF